MIEQLEHQLSQPSPADIDAMARLDNDLIILGVGGKMGPTLVRRACNVSNEAGIKREIIAVSRSRPAASSAGFRHIPADLLDPSTVRRLPDAANVIYLVGRKFGSSGNEALTWAANTVVPVLTAERYADSRIVALSTGNVYPFMSPSSGGATEYTPLAPVGECAQSALARERILEYFAQEKNLRAVILRFNYAVEPSYGVLVDPTLKMLNKTPIDLTVGYVNFVWQGDANSIAIRALHYRQSPSRVFNVTGAETHSVRTLATPIGNASGIDPVFENHESTTALLNDSSEGRRIFGEPSGDAGECIRRTVPWLQAGGSTLGKATHFETRSGKF